MPRPLDVVGLHEAADMLGMQKSHLSRAVRDGSIRPDARLHCGPIWRRSSIVRLREVRHGEPG